MEAEDGDKGVPREIRYGLVSENNPFTSFFNINDTTGMTTTSKAMTFTVYNRNVKIQFPTEFSFPPLSAILFINTWRERTKSVGGQILMKTFALIYDEREAFGLHVGK